MTKFRNLTPGLVTLGLLALVACGPSRPKPVAAVPEAATAPVPVTAFNGEPIVDESGKCTGPLVFDKAPYVGKPDDALLGLTECQIVALHGEAPLSVMTGASPQSKRETTMLYMEPKGKAVFLFSNNRLTRVVR